MAEFAAFYFDGRTSQRRSVRVHASPMELRIRGDGVDCKVPLAGVTVDPPIGSARRMLRLADGAQLQTDDNAAVEELFPGATRMQSFVHRLEREWTYAVAAVFVVIAVTLWLVLSGVPLAAKGVSVAVPPEREAAFGARMLGRLDDAHCRQSTIELSRQGELRGRLAVLTAGLGDGYAYRVEFRGCEEIGANALALPGGMLVITDQLVQLARNDDQIVAVLAHEVGHVHYRHSLRQALQVGGLGALLALFGGGSSSESLALVQLGYSRDFEEEADEFAYQRLMAIGISPRRFGEMLQLLEGERGGKDESRAALGYLSTHPSSDQRIQRAFAVQFERVRPLPLATAPSASQPRAERPATTVPLFDAHVTDLTGTLQRSQRDVLELELAQFAVRRGVPIAVLIVPTTQPLDIEAYGAQALSGWKLARRGKTDGLLLLVAMEDQRVSIRVGDDMRGTVSDATAKRIVTNDIVPAFKGGNYHAGIRGGTMRLMAVIERGR